MCMYMMFGNFTILILLTSILVCCANQSKKWSLQGGYITPFDWLVNYMNLLLSVLHYHLLQVVRLITKLLEVERVLYSTRSTLRH